VAFPGVVEVPAEGGAVDGTADVTGGGDAGGVVVGGVAAQAANIRPAPIVTANRAGVRITFKAYSRLVEDVCCAADAGAALLATWGMLCGVQQQR
jgi:hypothetical protein